MGFYAPAQIVGDARENGVDVRAVDVSHSFSQNTLEERRGAHHAVRLGFRQIDGFKWRDPDEINATDDDDWGARIVAARAGGPFASLEDFAQATRLPKRALILLADADAFRSIKLDRRAALWAARRLPDEAPLPLFMAAAAREQPDEAARPLPAMPLPEQVMADYQTVRLSLKGHPMQFLRAMFMREGILACREICAARDGQRARCAGVVLVRQRPGSAKGVVFMTLEDETGIANIVVWPKVMARFRKEVMGARLVLVEGRIQSSPEQVVHLVADRLIDRSCDLLGLANDALVAPPDAPSDVPAQKHRHPRNVRLLPPSRDFH